jgi:hypothetical protein
MSYGAPISVLENNWAFDGDTSSIFNQTFAQLIIERQETDTSESLHSIFKCIKEKLFAINEIPNQIQDTTSLKEKYNIDNVKNVIGTFKKDLAKLYDEKLKLDFKVNNYLTKYTKFLNSINDVTEQIQCINDNPDTSDFEKVITDRIEWYYSKLKIGELVESQKQNELEFNFLKSTIVELSGMTNPVVCQICFVNQVAFFVNPCGHTLCESCKVKCQTLKNCHYCRSEIKSFNKLFL